MKNPYERKKLLTLLGAICGATAVTKLLSMVVSHNTTIKCMLLLGFVFGISMVTKAQTGDETYGIRIGGVEVTSENYQNISAEGGFPAVKSGMVKFLPTSRKLTLSNATIDGGEETAIEFTSAMFNATLTATGINKVYSASPYSIVTATDLSIDGGGVVQAGMGDNTSGAFLVTNLKSLILADAVMLEANGTSYGLQADNGREQLRISEKARLIARGTQGCILGFNGIYLYDDIEVIQPHGAVANYGSVMLDGQVCTGEVIIGYADRYGIRIGGVELTEANYQNISAEGGFPAVKRGYLKFDRGSNTLYLTEGTSVESANTHGIEFYGEGVRRYTLQLHGESKVSAQGRPNSALSTSVRLIIEGDICSFNAEGGAGIEVKNGVTLIIGGCQITAHGGQHGIRGTTRTEHMEIYDADVRAQGRSSSVSGFQDIALYNCQITSPPGAYIENGEVRVEGSATNEEVVIRRVVPLGLKIGGVEVTNLNYENITAEGGFECVREGRVTFDPRTQTLTLDNAVIKHAGGSTAITIDGNTAVHHAEWTLSLIGDNKVVSHFAGLLADVEVLIVKGDADAVLSIVSEGREAIGILKSMRIRSCSVEAEGFWGISGCGRLGTLMVEDANVRAKGEGGSVSGLAAFYMRNCEIVEPEDAAWNAEEGAICHTLSDAVVTDEVIIRKMDTNALQATPANATAKPQGTFSLKGVRQQTELDRLPKGVYVRGGQKVLKK